MIRLSALAICASLTAMGCASGPQQTEAVDVAFDAARLSDHTRILSADDFQGRGIATPAEDKVIAYLSQQYAAAGFEPGGDNGGWTQAVALNRMATTNVTARLSVGDWTQTLEQGEQAVQKAPAAAAGSDVSAAVLPSQPQPVEAAEAESELGAAKVIAEAEAVGGVPQQPAAAASAGGESAAVLAASAALL